MLVAFFYVIAKTGEKAKREDVAEAEYWNKGRESPINRGELL